MSTKPFGPSVDRRQFIRIAGSVAATAIISPLFSRPAWAADPFEDLVAKAKSAGENRVVMAGGTGAYVDMVNKYFYEPFTKATGISVENVGGSYGDRIAKLMAMKKLGTVQWDMISTSADYLTPTITPMLRDLNSCRLVPEVLRNGVPGSCLGRAVTFDMGAAVLAYDTRKFPGGGPQNWVDFWNTKRFPGPRAMPNFGVPWWPMIAALLADGVPSDRLFPLDMDRAFRKLDVIKPDVTVWWNSGDQSQQVFRNGEVVMGMMLSGRVARLQEQGLPLKTIWNGAPLDSSVWAAVNGGPHPNATLALLDFIYTRPEAHAQYMRASKAATAMQPALVYLTPAEKERLAVSPSNWSQVVRIDPNWLAKYGATAQERWVNWIGA
ncbi:extracellular solute-binding protein [Paraburkholderia phymatum]|uniref:Extracellular solute-binding protein n=1 Tax=Paraburkholderia phymatum TaxID=148447 RepID=A0ACC6UCB2_9BURK